MSRKNTFITAGIAVILLGLVGGAAWLYAGQNGEQARQQPAAQQTSMSQSEEKPDDVGDRPAQSAAAPGVYQEYSLAALQNAEQRERVLFFHAPWCPQCRALEADIKARGVPADIAIFKIDYDSNQELRQKYGVTQQTTVVHIDADGNKIRSFLPYSDPSLQNALNGLGL